MRCAARRGWVLDGRRSIVLRFARVHKMNALASVFFSFSFSFFFGSFETKEGRVRTFSSRRNIYLYVHERNERKNDVIEDDVNIEAGATGAII